MTSAKSHQIFATGPSPSDTELLSHLDFVAEAHRLMNWSRIGLAPPIIVPAKYDPTTQESAHVVLDSSVEEAALAAGIRRSIVVSRRRRFRSYSGQCVAQVDGDWLLIRGSEAHENRNHDLVHGELTANRVYPVPDARLQSLIRDVVLRADTQLTVTLSHLAGLDIAPSGALAVDDALSDVLWRMERAGWTSITVEHIEVSDELAAFVDVSGSLHVPASSDYGLCMTTRSKGTRFQIRRVPRAGSKQLIGELSLPGH